tara:strand:+ start:1265 stop:1720 length:456 start_codon:yes stop_codon:yes gene_type:complete
VSKQKTYKQKITKWIDSVLTISRAEIGGMPICPFIKQYRDKIHIVETTAPMTIAKNFADLKETLDIEACILYGKRYSFEKLHKICNRINSLYKTKNVVCLAMHPDSEEPPLALEYNFEYPILILQRKNTLEDARNRLQNTDYYTFFQDSAK